MLHRDLAFGPQFVEGREDLLFRTWQAGHLFEAPNVSYGTHMPRADWRVVAEVELPVPPLPEQRAIATVLSDVDGLIGSLEELIAKKRAIRRAAMQQLLTGTNRLPEFRGEWVSRRLGEVAKIAMGSTPSRNVPAYWGGEHVWLSVSDLKGRAITESRERITHLAAVQMQAVPTGTLLLGFKLSIGRVGFAGCSLDTNEVICSVTRLSVHADCIMRCRKSISCTTDARRSRGTR